jgi:hypothetical protein
VHELEDAAVTQGEAFEKLVIRAGPHQETTTLVRNIHTMIHPSSATLQTAQSEMAPTMRVGRQNVVAGADDEFNHCYNSVHVPTYERAVGVICGRRFRAVVGEPTYLTIYELAEANVCGT